MTGLSADHIEKLMSNPKIRATIEANIEIIKGEIMSNTLDDFFGDGSEESIPECSFCGDKEGELIVSIQDAYGPTHWHHAACEAADDAKKGTPLTPTWDEAMEIMINDPLIDGRETADFEAEMQAEADSGLPQLCSCGELMQDCDCNPANYLIRSC